MMMIMALNNANQQFSINGVRNHWKQFLFQILHQHYKQHHFANSFLVNFGHICLVYITASCGSSRNVYQHAGLSLLPFSLEKQRPTI